MKTWNNLWEPFSTEENFSLAYANARRGKSRQRQVIEFAKNADANLKAVREYAISGNYHTSGYQSRVIYEPKERTIYILKFNPDRIVQHAMVNILEPYFERYFIADSYACIKGKGQQAGSLRCMEAVRRNKYCLKCDIHHFYPSIRHDLLFKQYKEKISDKKFLAIIEDVVYSFPGERNIPIGNLLSAWSGNFFLTPLDFFCKHELKAREYIRYCDDFLLFSNDKAWLHDCRKRIEDFIHTRLDLEFSKSDVFNVKQGVDFLGYRHFEKYILVRKRTAKRMQKRIAELPEKYERGKITLDQFRSQIDSVSGWISHANAHNLALSMNLREIRKRYIENAENKRKKTAGEIKKQ